MLSDQQRSTLNMIETFVRVADMLAAEALRTGWHHHEIRGFGAGKEAAERMKMDILAQNTGRVL